MEEALDKMILLLASLFVRIVSRSCGQFRKLDMRERRQIASREMVDKLCGFVFQSIVDLNAHFSSRQR